MIDNQKLSDANRLTEWVAQSTALSDGTDSTGQRVALGAAAPNDAIGRDGSAVAHDSSDSVADGCDAMLTRLHRVLGERQASDGDTPVLSADPDALAKAFAALVAAGVDRPPLPGSGPGMTLMRWRMLAAVAGCDVPLVKLYEGHTDALAILAELRGDTPAAGTRWGVWAAEPPNARLMAHRSEVPPPAVPSAAAPSASHQHRGDRSGPRHGERVLLKGRKAWCSGAAQVTHALVTAWIDEQSCLVSVAMDQPGVTVTRDGWHARGMAATASVDVLFDDVEGVLIGAPGDYLSRPGFWQGGAGIAACWMGTAAAIARYTMNRLAAKARAHGSAAELPSTATSTSESASTRRSAPDTAPSSALDLTKLDDISALYAAELDLAMATAVTVLRETANAIDAAPMADARMIATRARLDIEALVDRVLRTAGRALGAGPLCRDAQFAAWMTDLPVFLRQSHAERDLAAYGRGALAACVRVADRSLPQREDRHATEESRWTL